jgi:hypothetical protein
MVSATSNVARDREGAMVADAMGETLVKDEKPSVERNRCGVLG